MVRFAPVLWLIALPGAALAQQGERSPDFSQGVVAVASDDLYTAWNVWRASDQDLEQRVFELPMADARRRIQTAFSDLLAYIDKRRAYSQAVAACIASRPPDIRAAGSLISVNVVNADEIDLIGVNISAVQRKLNILRTVPDWLQIRSSVQKDRSEVLDLQQTLRQGIQIEFPMDSSNSYARPISLTVYRDSERQIREALARLWTHYYQALVDSVEQKRGQSTPLIASSIAPATNPAGAFPGSVGQLATASSGTNGPLVGTWTYVEGSEQFNGIAEPKHVILELWMENGMLVGRYRADLPDFDQTTKVDLSLHGKPGFGRTILEFRSTSPEAVGRIILEEPSNKGANLMLVRSVEDTPIPRGRELLTRH
jgi:hypothetical protein